MDCAAANPHIINCGSRTGIPEMPMHYLPKDETIRQTLIRFVRIPSKVPNCRQNVQSILTIVVLIWWARKSERVRYIF